VIAPFAGPGDDAAGDPRGLQDQPGSLASSAIDGGGGGGPRRRAAPAKGWETFTISLMARSLPPDDEIGEAKESDYLAQSRHATVAGEQNKFNS
jgi:hypothetical protein